jgi:putative peptidoglycan lipid II flippase
MCYVLLKRYISGNSVASGAAVLAFTQFGASLAGLVRDRVLAGAFPPGRDQLDVVSVYIAAFRPSDLLFQMLVMSALSVALVPLLASHLAHGREEEMNKLTSSVLLLFNVLFGILVLTLTLTLPWIAPFLVKFQGESLELYVSFARLASLTNFLFVSGNILGHVLITRQTYVVYGITPVLFTVGTIVGTLAIDGPYGPMVGTVAGALMYVALRTWAVVKAGYQFSIFNFQFSKVVHPELREMGFLMIPRALALGAVQLELLLFDTLASGLGLGAVTVNAYARNFQSVAVGVIGIALAQSVFSSLSQAHAREEHERFKALLKESVGWVLLSSIAATVGLIVLAPFAAWLVNITGTPVLPLFLFAVAMYALGIPFESINHLLHRAFYAQRDSRTPAVASVMNAVVAVTVTWLLLPRFGVVGIGIGFVIGQAVQTVLLWGGLRRVHQYFAKLKG